MQKYPSILALLLISQWTLSQNVLSVNKLDSIYSENFNGLGTDCPSLTSSLTGWAVFHDGNKLETISTNSGNADCDSGTDIGGAFSYGAEANADRALGGRVISGDIFELHMVFQNNTGADISTIGVSYAGEQWFAGNSATNTQSIELFVGVGTDSASATDNANTNANLSFNNPRECTRALAGLGACNGIRGPLDGNDNQNRTILRRLINLPQTVENGAFVTLIWRDNNNRDANTSHALAVDDVEWVAFNDTITTWYFLNNETNPDDESSWTRWPNYLYTSTELPSDPFPDGFTDTDARFIVNKNFNPIGVFEFLGDNITLDLLQGLTGNFADDIYLRGNNATLNIAGVFFGDGGDFVINGTNSRVNFLEGADITLIANNGVLHDANVSIFNDVQFTYSALESGNNKNITLDTCYDFSSVIYDGQFGNGALECPGGNFYDLAFTNSGDGNMTYTMLDSFVVRNSYSYQPANDRVNAPVAPLTFAGENSVLNVPNYSGSGILGKVYVASGAELTLGNVSSSARFPNQWIHNDALIIEEGGTFLIDNEQTVFLNNAAATFTQHGLVEIANSCSFILPNAKAVDGSGLISITRNQGETPSEEIFNHWSSPVSGSQIGPDGVVNGVRNFKYRNGEDDNADYIRINALEPMEVGRGYSSLGNLSSTFLANGPEALNFGNITYKAYANEDADADAEKYYLVGNPYSSGLSASDFISANSPAEIKGTIYLFSQQNSFGTFDRTADNIAVNLMGSSDLGPASGTVENADNFDDVVIASGQGFFVLDIDDNSPDDSISLSFTAAMQTGINHDFKSNTGEKKSEITRRFWLSINNQSNYKSTLVGFAEDATRSFDNAYDAPKSISTASLDIWSYSEDAKYEIQGLPEVDVASYRVPLGVNVPSAGMYNLGVARYIGDDAQAITLIDAANGTFVDISKEPYTFTAESEGQIIDRFFLFIRGQGQPVGLDAKLPQTANCNPHISPADIVEEFKKGHIAEFQVFNPLGECIYNREDFDLTDFYSQKSGMYVIQYRKSDDYLCKQKYLWY